MNIIMIIITTIKLFIISVLHYQKNISFSDINHTAFFQNYHLEKI